MNRQNQILLSGFINHDRYSCYQDELHESLVNYMSYSCDMRLKFKRYLPNTRKQLHTYLQQRKSILIIIYSILIIIIVQVVMKSQREFNVEEQKIGRYLYFINSIIIYLHVPTYLYVVLY